MEITLTPHICAYLDVLGGSKIFDDGDSQAADFFLSSMLEFERRLNGLRRDGTPVVKTFTDNIFAAIPLSTTSRFSVGEQVTHFLQEVSAQLQHFLLVAELPMRGAITIGSMLINDKFVFGPAVLQAVRAEEKAIYPRVVLDASVLQALPKQPFVDETLVYTATDGVSSLNYLGLQSWVLKRHREVAENALFAHRTDAAVAAKYQWLLDYNAAIKARIGQLGLGTPA
ncbi:hypothetical protein SNE35_26500 [Paucibacter sp. R3-3]|uniref:Uncharacterized protein n=1 Tax=Roseateles agri TaxID=3098619 RepID=A0ABU5DS58_9BURK|nr:hypothetical protein [Paucibacter sp. R3-3]MDY0748079.1 hypothetical protein [Paucibacter sp. R3-3]